METIILVLDNVGRIMTIVTSIAFIMGVIACAKGLFPILKRFGINRSKLKIAIVAKASNNYEEIKQTLAKNKLIPHKNINQISLNIIKDIDEYSAVIVHEDALDMLDNVVGYLSSRTCLIVYAPKKYLDEKQKQVLQNQPVSTLVNFRGRLINDVITMLASAQNVEK